MKNQELTRDSNNFIFKKKSNEKNSLPKKDISNILKMQALDKLIKYKIMLRTSRF